LATFHCRARRLLAIIVAAEVQDAVWIAYRTSSCSGETPNAAAAERAVSVEITISPLSTAASGSESGKVITSVA
jgi:hypothetical protein